MDNLFNLIAGKRHAERAAIKSEALQKMPVGNKFTNKEYGVSVKIISIEKIDGGVEVLARGWIGSKQVGFGDDGTVDMERFKIYNPPILVNDPNGDIVKEWIDNITGEKKMICLREDPMQALKDTLAHTIKVIAKDGQNIIKGKIGNTTSTFYPEAHTASVAGDWTCYNTNTSWAATHDATAGNNTLSNETNLDIISYKVSAGEWYIRRGFLNFDTSSLTAGATISSAVLTLYETGKNDGDNDAQGYITLVDGTPASATVGVNGDFDQVGTTHLSNDQDITGITDNATYDLTLNASGLAAISKTGVSKFALREGHDLENSAITSSYNRSEPAAADYAGSTNDPKLVVTFTTAPTVNETSLNRTPMRGVMRGVMRP